MFKSKIDIKTIFILVLGVAVILLLLFGPSKEINTHEEEILILKTQNRILSQDNDLSLIHI